METILKDIFLPVSVGVLSTVLSDLITRRIERLRRKTKLRVLIAVIASLLVASGLYGVYVYWDSLRCHLLGQPFLKIESPEQNAQIPCGQVMVSGTSCGLAQRKAQLNIYLLVHPLTSGSKWVQANFGPPARDGSWRQIAALGGIDNFEIFAIATKDSISVGQYPLSKDFSPTVESNTVYIQRIP
jgi:hypothetical protein